MRYLTQPRGRGPRARCGLEQKARTHRLSIHQQQPTTNKNKAVIRRRPPRLDLAGQRGSQGPSRARRAAKPPLLLRLDRAAPRPKRRQGPATTEGHRDKEPGSFPPFASRWFHLPSGSLPPLPLHELTDGIMPCRAAAQPEGPAVPGRASPLFAEHDQATRARSIRRHSESRVWARDCADAINAIGSSAASHFWRPATSP